MIKQSQIYERTGSNVLSLRRGEARVGQRPPGGGEARRDVQLGGGAAARLGPKSALGGGAVRAELGRPMRLKGARFQIVKNV